MVLRRRWPLVRGLDTWLDIKEKMDINTVFTILLSVKWWSAVMSPFGKNLTLRKLPKDQELFAEIVQDHEQKTADEVLEQETTARIP